LGYKNTRQALASNVYSDDKVVHTVDYPSGPHLTFIRGRPLHTLTLYWAKTDSQKADQCMQALDSFTL
jgi:hypothetical protein